MKRLWTALALGSLWFGLTSNLSAQTFTWEGPLSGTSTWSAANWSPGTPPVGGGTNVSLFFTGATTGYTANNNLGNPFVVNSIQFGQFFTTSSSIANSASNSLQLGGANPSIGTPIVGGFDPNTGSTITFSMPLSLNPSSGSVTLGGMGNGVVVFNGVLSGTANLRIAGNPIVNTSFVRLGAANTFTGNVTLDGGHLVLNNASALGSAVTNSLIVNSGWLGFSASITVANNINLNNHLQLMSLTGSLTHTGIISGNHDVRLSGLTSGTSSVSLFGANTYTGKTIIDTAPMFGQGTNAPINNGVLIIIGDTGSISNSSEIIVRSGTLTVNNITNFTGGAGGRINDNANVRLGGGIYNVISGTGINYNETVASLILESGHNTVTVQPTASSTTKASFANLVRENRATILFRGNNLGGNFTSNQGTVGFNSSPTGDMIGGGGAAGSTNISILPYAIGHDTNTGAGNNLVTIEGGSVRPLNSATEYVINSITGGTTTDHNVRVSTSINLNSPNLTTRNALVITGGTVSNSQGGALRLTSGTILSTGSITISANLDFGSQEAIVFSTAGLNLTGVISGTGGFTKAGSGELVLTNANNNYSGVTTINAGRITIGNAAALGNSTSIQTGGPNTNLDNLFRASLATNTTNTIALSQGITVHSGLFDLNVPTNGTLQLNGQISGAGGLMTSGTGTVVLTNANNNYTGMTRVFNGFLRFGSDAHLGNGGGVDIGATTTTGVVLDGHWTTNRQVNISFSSLVNTNGFNWTQNGPFTGTSTATLNKGGAGTFTLNADKQNSTFAGTLNVNAGRMNVNGYLAASSNAFTVAANAFLGGTGEIDRPVTISSGGTLAPGESPGTLTVSSRIATAVTFSANAIFEFDIHNAIGTMGANWDLLHVPNAAVSLPTAMTVRLVGLDITNNPGAVLNWDFANNYTWQFISANSFTGTAFGSVVFTIDTSAFADNNPLGGGSFSIIQIGSTGLALQFNSAVVPEPGTLALFGGLAGAAGGLGWYRRRQKLLAAAEPE